MDRYKEVDKLLRENKIFGEVSQPSDNVVVVEISWGDWKHDHARLKCLMTEKLKAVPCGMEVTEDDGSDTFSAKHTFFLN